MNTASVQWTDELTFSAVTGSEHRLVLDGKRAAGPSPMELLLTGMAGCTAIDVVHILKRQRQPLTGLTVNVSGIRADDNPKVYTHITVEYVAQGDIDENKLKRAIELSEEKYCSASIMLGKTAKIESSYRIERESAK